MEKQMFLLCHMCIVHVCVCVVVKRRANGAKKNMWIKIKEGNKIDNSLLSIIIVEDV